MSVEEAEVSVKSSVFKPVMAADRVDYPTLERTIQQWWDEQDVLREGSDLQRARCDDLVPALCHGHLQHGDSIRGLPGDQPPQPVCTVPTTRPPRRIPAGVDDHAMDAHCQCCRSRPSRV